MNFGFILGRNKIRSSCSQPEKNGDLYREATQLIQFIYRALFYLTTTGCHFLSACLSYQRRPLGRQHRCASGNGKRELSDTAMTVPGASPTPASVGLGQLNITSCPRCNDRGGNCYLPYLATPRRVEGRWSSPAGNSPRRIKPTGSHRSNS